MFSNLVIVAIQQDDVILCEVVQWGGATPPVVVKHHLKIPVFTLALNQGITKLDVLRMLAGTSHNKEGSMTESKALSPPKARASSENPDFVKIVQGF